MIYYISYIIYDICCGCSRHRVARRPDRLHSHLPDLVICEYLDLQIPRYLGT